MADFLKYPRQARVRRGHGDEQRFEVQIGETGTRGLGSNCLKANRHAGADERGPEFEEQLMVVLAPAMTQQEFERAPAQGFIAGLAEGLKQLSFATFKTHRNPVSDSTIFGGGISLAHDTRMSRSQVARPRLSYGPEMRLPVPTDRAGGTG